MRNIFSDAEFSDSTEAVYRGWVFYDGECEFCTGWVHRFEPTLLARGFHCAALQDAWVAPLLRANRAELLRGVRVWLPAGAAEEETLGISLVGAEAVIFLAREFFWARPLVWLARSGAGRRWIHAVYERIAARRHCLAACAPLAAAAAGKLK